MCLKKNGVQIPSQKSEQQKKSIEKNDKLSLLCHFFYVAHFWFLPFFSSHHRDLCTSCARCAGLATTWRTHPGKLWFHYLNKGLKESCISKNVPKKNQVLIMYISRQKLDGYWIRIGSYQSIAKIMKVKGPYVTQWWFFSHCEPGFRQAPRYVIDWDVSTVDDIYNIWGFLKIRVPQNGWLDHLGVPLSPETSI